MQLSAQLRLLPHLPLHPMQLSAQLRLLLHLRLHPMQLWARLRLLPHLPLHPLRPPLFTQLGGPHDFGNRQKHPLSPLHLLNLSAHLQQALPSRRLRRPPTYLLHLLLLQTPPRAGRLGC
jgi:hypothetical protein